jgi:hypothetical protein
MKARFSLPALALLLAGGACATTSSGPSAQRLETSSAAIRAAEEVGATHSPEAALHLQLAKEQFEHARQLTNPNDKAWADRLLMRAEADAELSLALARSKTEQDQAMGAIDRAHALKNTAAP